MPKRKFRSPDEIKAAEAQAVKLRDAEIARIREETRLRLRDLDEERRELESGERARRRKARQRLAFVLGEFLLRNEDGDVLEDATIRAIVESDAFDAFTRAPKYRSARSAFGLEDVPDAPKAAVGKSGAAQAKAA